MPEDRSPEHHDDERPPARNPFDESQLGQSEHEPLEKPALIKSRRAAAIAGMVTGFIILILIIGVCVLGSIAFGS